MLLNLEFGRGKVLILHRQLLNNKYVYRDHNYLGDALPYKKTSGGTLHFVVGCFQAHTTTNGWLSSKSSQIMTTQKMCIGNIVDVELLCTSMIDDR